MEREIERKFLIYDIPLELVRNAESKRILQGYLHQEDGRELRVRRMGGHFFLTEKQGSGLVREETEVPISKEVFELLWPYTESAQISKFRYSFVLDGHVMALDEFDGRLSSLCLVEVEFRTEREAADYQPPSFVKKDVTKDPRYKNAYLAKHGLPQD